MWSRFGDCKSGFVIRENDQWDRHSCLSVTHETPAQASRRREPSGVVMTVPTVFIHVEGKAVDMRNCVR